MDLFKGRINYAIVSSGYQQGENRSIDALEDIISEWAFTLDGLDLQGRNHLSNPGSAQFICQDYEKNPALTLRNILLAHDGFSSFDIDENSILQAAKDCHENGLDLEGIHGGVIPKSSGCVDGLQDRSEILQELARNFGHNLVPLASGKVGLKKIGSSNSDEKLVHYSSASNDFQNAFLTIQHNPLKRANEVRALLRHSHATSGNHEGYLRGYNQVSQEVFGKAEQQWNYSFQRDVKVLEKVLGPRISLRSGRAKMIIFSVPGFKGLQDGSDVGDVIKVTAPQTYGDFSNRKIMVTGKSVDLINGGVKFQGLTLDNQIGVVAFSSEETVVIPASESTFIGATEIPCSGNSFPYADANTSYGNLGFLMHGHHYAYSGVCANSSFGFGNVNWVSIITWQLNADDWENRTIKSIGIVLNVESIPSLRFESEGPFQTRSNWDGCSLHNSSKDLQSIHGSFNNYVTIADGNLDSLYKDEIGEFAVGTGKVHIPLNSRGKESFAKASVNENYGTSRVILLLKRFSKGDYTNAVKISSIHSSNYNNNPLAVVSYIT